MNTLIVEDEPLVARDLQKLIYQIDPSIQILATLDSVKSSAEYLKSHTHPDLIFMDIQLNDGVSFDLFSQVQISCSIIFTTAYDEYAIRAFKVNSIGYLLKPIDKSELAAALDKYKALQPSDYFKSQLHLLISQLNQPKETKIYKERFAAHSGKAFVIISQSNISYFQKETIIYIVTNDNKRFVTDFQTMDEIEELLDPKLFFRANRQLIVHADAISSFRSDVYGKIIVTLHAPLNLPIDISREKAMAFKGWIE
jgi:DNA-binding LytR/AlgR family response regulator